MCQLLVTDPDTGIIGDGKDIKRRQLLFGRNKIALPSVTSFLDLLASQFEEPALIGLIVAATIYLFLSLFGVNNVILMETLTIYSGALFAAVTSAFFDWLKERQFLKLKDEMNN